MRHEHLSDPSLSTSLPRGPTSNGGQPDPDSGAPNEDRRSAEQNRILQLLPPEDYAWVSAHSELVPAPHGEILAEPGQPLAHVYFPQTSVASLVNPTDRGMVEVGTVGNEGMVGLSVFLDGGALPSRTLWQVAGTTRRMPAVVFAGEVERRPALSRLLRRYTHAFFVQVAQTAACNRMHAIEQRCARWLLMTHDRVGGAATFGLTHEFLAFMLGVRRAGVTEAAGLLQARRLIRYTRGSITVVDRAGLEGAACECYGVVQAHFARALPSEADGARRPPVTSA